MKELIIIIAIIAFIAIAVSLYKSNKKSSSPKGEGVPTTIPSDNKGKIGDQTN